MDNKQILGQNIKDYRQLRGMTQAQLADAIGCASSTIAMYETGKREPDMDTIEAIADIFNVRKRDLIPDDGKQIPHGTVLQLSSMQYHIIPLIGSAAAGEPVCNEEISVYVDGPLKADCAIRVEGRSMEPTFLDGDLLYVRTQPTVDFDGQIAVVICGDEACVKHVYRQEDGLMLMSDNPKYAPMLKQFSDYDGNIRILGKVIGYTRIFKQS